ncbi:MAG: ribonuclease J [Fimbriimonadaceae bacterium]|nr:ribonuclease J [Fimbriimonadaceae bacterium]QYK55784.1 MAG: ribonuclease J [Fimbriimonadaceae bacterium]
MSLVQVIPLGGCGEIGKNCTVLRQGDEAIVVDVGISFPHEEHYGVDIVIPDFHYLIENRDAIKGIFLTHAHEDHVGALSFLLPKLKVPVYATAFTAAMVRSKIEERAGLKDIDLRIVKPGETVTLDQLSVEFVRVTHSIPETCALAVRTGHGIVFFTADFKFDFTPIDRKTTDIGRLSELGQEGVVLMLSDSTNVDRPGWSPSESAVTPGFRKLFQQAEGRVLVTMFSSNIHRMQQVFDVAHATGRKVAVTGRRMENTIEICRSLQYLTIPSDTYVRMDDIAKYRPNQLAFLVTGSQAELMAALNQMSRGEYSRMKIVPGDTVLYSARPIPGNEGPIWRMVNRLHMLGAEVIMESESPIHASGHGYEDEIKMMVNLVKPYYIAPVHGEPRHQAHYSNLAFQLGYPEHRVFRMQNGDTLNMDDTKAWVGERVRAGDVLIDQHGNVPVTDKLLGERSALGHDGVIVVSLGADLERGAIVARPEAQARGYSGPTDVVEDALDTLCDALGEMRPDRARDRAAIEKLVVEVVGQTISRRCQQRPVVLPVVVEL